ncbi:MAG: hypothetical protein GEU75_12110 [Dehalococcoidia bacterium]|nr:hypothetical protein [Dehalococcoidia bacterium]
MQSIKRDDVFTLLERVCQRLTLDGIDYVVYGSAGYALLTEAAIEPADVDIMVWQADLDRICTSLSEPDLALNSILTPFSVHANSLIYNGPDGKPFDISLDSWEHYFTEAGLDFGRYEEVGSTKIRVMQPEDLLCAYEIGLDGGNDWKYDEYARKIDRLHTLIANRAAAGQ